MAQDAQQTLVDSPPVTRGTVCVLSIDDYYSQRSNKTYWSAEILFVGAGSKPVHVSMGEENLLEGLPLRRDVEADMILSYSPSSSPDVRSRRDSQIELKYFKPRNSK